MRCPLGRASTLSALAMGLALLGTGCSGGDGDDDNQFVLAGAVINVDSTTYAGSGVVCVDFTVSGPVGTVFELLAQYQLLGTAGFVGASPIPPALNAPPFNIPASSALTGLVIGPNGTLSGRFYWYAGADLGFLASQALFSITPFSNGDPNNPNGQGGLSPLITYAGGNAPQNSGGPGAGQTSGNPPGGTGRASHTSTNVRSGVAPGSVKNLLVAGGYNNSTNPGSNAFNTADRFNFDENTFTHSVPFSGQMTNAALGRVLHASSFFLDPSTGFIKVLVTGGVSRCDPSAASLALRIAGATEYDTGSIYSFSPTEQVLTPLNAMSANRFGHTATWVPNNDVVIIGGANGVGTPTVVLAIEHYRPFGNSFVAAPNSAVISFPRVEHTATLLPDGRILVAGGYNPATPGNTLLCEIYDPVQGLCTPVANTALNRFGHTATRLANGWVVIVGGRSLATNALLNNAVVYKPELGGFDPTPITMDRARALHTATLLGSRQLLIAGGLAGDPANPSIEDFTTSAQVFRAPDCFSAVTPNAFSPVNPLVTPRGEHTATAVDCGSVFVIGGRNSVGSPSGLNFLDSIEFYAFSNAVPVVSAPLTSASQTAGTLGINFSVTDADADGGYVVVRYRTTVGSGSWSLATISAQTPSSAGSNYPNHEVCPGNYLFVWNFLGDGVPNATQVEIQIIPFGAVIGSPVSFVAVTP